MSHKETISSTEMVEFLQQACEKKASVVGSYQCEGKWRLLEMETCGFSEDFIAFRTDTLCKSLRKDQPVGICIHLDYYKYIFDTQVQAVETQDTGWRVLLDPPEKIERVQRRMYERESVPRNLKVKVLFWHRGYLDDHDQSPEEMYWQGLMLNLSAGGAQFEIDLAQKSNFRVGQLLGVQFTPMSYQKPFLLESHVRYLKENNENHHFKIGVEFLGLEASPEGRETLNRLLGIIAEYEAVNQQNAPAENSKTEDTPHEK